MTPIEQPIEEGAIPAESETRLFQSTTTPPEDTMNDDDSRASGALPYASQLNHEAKRAALPCPRQRSEYPG
jgi:hypothetical protein